MTKIPVGDLTFSFPAESVATKYDEWEFYVKRFQRIKDGTKAVDVLCVLPDAAWLLEVKDYREHERTKPSELSEEIAGKVRDTLSGLAAASANAERDDEKVAAKRALGKRNWRVVLHLEQGEPAGSALWPRGINVANVLQKLRGRLKSVDENALVCNRDNNPDEVPWTVE